MNDGLLFSARTATWGLFATLSLTPACEASNEVGAPSSRSATLTRQSESTETLKELSKQLGVQFPVGTRLLGVVRDAGGMDSSLRVKVQMPFNAFSGFFEQTPVSAEFSRPGTRGLFGSDSGFWDPHNAKALKSWQSLGENGMVFNLGVSQESPDTTVVYLVLHST